MISHRNPRKDILARQFILDEALQLNTTLNALNQHLSLPGNDLQEGDAPTTVDLALCISARLALYHMYACNLPDPSAERLAEESMMQTECIEGIKDIISSGAAILAQNVLQQGAENLDRSSPLVLQSLYDVATECQWFIREGAVVEGAENTLQLLIEALTLLRQRWSVAG